jgi:hypothetical protein
MKLKQIIYVLFICAIFIICVSCARKVNDEPRETKEPVQQIPQAATIESLSGHYLAYVIELDDDNVKGFQIGIRDLAEDSADYLCDLTFRNRDVNIIVWADKEDVLWAYNSDIGTFLWVREDNTWSKIAFNNSAGYEVPAILKEERPRLFN